MMHYPGTKTWERVHQGKCMYPQLYSPIFSTSRVCQNAGVLAQAFLVTQYGERCLLLCHGLPSLHPELRTTYLSVRPASLLAHTLPPLLPHLIRFHYGTSSVTRDVSNIGLDRFAKACKLIPQPKLPSAKETTDLLLQHVVRVHGFPTDIVSDQGTQFASWFWKAICHHLGAMVSLSSGFYPEFNGQTKRVNQDLECSLRCLVSASHGASHLGCNI